MLRPDVRTFHPGRKLDILAVLDIPLNLNKDLPRVFDKVPSIALLRHLCVQVA